VIGRMDRRGPRTLESGSSISENFPSTHSGE
jgi:hypothetical protein